MGNGCIRLQWLLKLGEWLGIDKGREREYEQSLLGNVMGDNRQWPFSME